MTGKVLRFLLKIFALLTRGRARLFRGDGYAALSRQHTDYLRQVRTPHLCIVDSEAGCAMFVTWNSGR